MATESKKTNWWVIGIAGLATGAVGYLVWVNYLKDKIMPAAAPAAAPPQASTSLNATGMTYIPTSAPRCSCVGQNADGSFRRIWYVCGTVPPHGCGTNTISRNVSNITMQKGFGACQCANGSFCRSSASGTCECCGGIAGVKNAPTRMVSSNSQWG